MAITTIATGMHGAIGSRRDTVHGGVVFVEYDGTVRRIDPQTGTTDVIGTGFTELEDIEISADGSTYFLSERGGSIYAVEAGAPFDLTGAKVLASGLGPVHQLAAVVDGSALYAIEYAAPGSLLRVDLSDASVSTVAGGFQQATGLVLDASQTRAFVSEQGAGGRIRSVPLSGGAPVVVASGLPAPFFLNWGDATNEKLVVAQRDPENALSVIHLNTSGPLVQQVTGLPFRPSSIVVDDSGAAPLGIVAADSEIATIDLTDALAAPIEVDMPKEAMFPGGYRRVPYRLSAGLTSDDVEFIVAEGPEAGMISPSRDALWDDDAPHVMLLARARTGTFTLVATHIATGDTLAKVEFEVTTEWADAHDGPPLAFVGESAPWVTGGAWGGGPAGVQNVNVMPATGTRRIGVILVDTADSRLPGTGTTTTDIQAAWANEVVASTADPDGILRSCSHYFQEVSDGRFDVSLTTGNVVGPVSLPGGWTDYFEWNDDRSFWGTKGNLFQAAGTAAQSMIDFDDVDTLVVITFSLTASLDPDTPDLFVWPIATGVNLSYISPGETTVKQKSIPVVSMPTDWTAVDGRRVHETLSHEIGHNLGLPDLYMNVTGFDPTIAARDVTNWDLMSNDGDLPHLSLGAKLMLGWMDPGLVRAYNFALAGGGVSDTLTLKASSNVGSAVVGTDLAGIEVRRADGWNYYFEYRQGQAADIADRLLPQDGSVIGTDVVSGIFEPPLARRMIVQVPMDVDGDGPVLREPADYEESDPSGPAEFSLEVLSRSGDTAQVRLSYGAGGKPDPSIRPWPGGDNWQSPDILVQNAKSDADSAWLNVPWAGHTNRVRATITNGGDFVANDVQVNFFVKNFAISGAPEVPIGSAIIDIPAGGSVPAEVNWTPPAASTTGNAHFCIVVRIPLYQDPGNPAIVELTELNNVAQSNYSRFISSDASPAVRGVTAVDVHNPYDRETRFWVVPSQTSEFFRTYVGHQWLKVGAGETRSVEVMYESLVGDPAYASTAGELRQRVYKVPNVVALVGLAENPHEKPHNAEVVGGATIQVVAARGSRFDWIKVDGADVYGRVVDKGTDQPVHGGRVLVTARVKGDKGKELYAAGTIGSNGEFHAHFRRLRKLPKLLRAENLGRDEKLKKVESLDPRLLRERPSRDAEPQSWVLEAEYLGTYGHGDCVSEEFGTTF
ncbi:hypothetical protein ASD56_15225 [Microbacterium sp. Root166]|uniref:hypothetical protein n=1 Tax=Microbacterium sp. Root166 TaxID=1736478 RepID=UPI0006F69D56|nr:hypothetical protein [Microbacterium sp. Root166]KQZ82221.1 hypothetical protein ASD56_15225 [Microbacterium sp. Root166]